MYRPSQQQVVQQGQQQRQAQQTPPAPEIFGAVPIMASPITARAYQAPPGPVFENPVTAQQRSIDQFVRRDQRRR